MALGPNAIIENMQQVADSVENVLDDLITKRHVRVDKNETSCEFVVDVAFLPLLTKDIWDTMLRKKYILAGWKSAEWISPINQFENDTIRLTK